MQALDPIRFFIEPLEANSIAYFITGSIASIFYGEPRLTHDIDLVVNLSSEEVPRFTSLFHIKEFYCPPDEVIQIEMRRKPYGHFNLIHHRSGFKADIYTESADALHQWAFKHLNRVTLSPELSLWLAPPEYLIIRKLEFYREGKSEKHMEDIKKMLPQISSVLRHNFLKQEIENRSLLTFAQQLPGILPR